MKCIYTALLFVLCCMAAHAQQSIPRQLHFNFLGVKDGLPEGSVNCLLQDTYGYIWIGTQNGLVRFDGYQTKIYPLESLGSVIADIQQIYEDSKGRLWVGAYPKGFYCYDRQVDTFIGYSLTPPGDTAKDNPVVLKIIEGDNDHLWLLARDFQKDIQDLILFDTKTKQSKRYSRIDKGSHFINAGSFFDVFKDVHGMIWLGTNNGLYGYNASKDVFTGHFNTTDSSQQKGVWQLAQDSANADVLWATGWNVKNAHDEGLWRYDMKLQTLQKFMHDSNNPSSIANNEIFTIKNFKKGCLWIATDTGISVFNTAANTFENYSPGDKRKKSFDNYIKTLSKDAAGNVWCRSAYGLLLFNSTTKTFTRFTTDNKNAAGLQSNTIRSMLLARDGLLWFGADQVGLQWINTGRSKFTHYSNSTGNTHHFDGGAVDAFAEAADASIWLTASGGLYHWIPSTDSFTRITLDKRAGSDISANAVAVSKDGSVWCRMYGNAGNVEGIYSYDPVTKKITNYRHHDKDSFSLPDDNVRVLQFDQDDILWVGTFGKGMSSFDKKTGRFTRYPYLPNTGYNDRSANHSGALDDDQVQTIYIDPQNNLWAGTNNGNLNYFNRSTKTFTARDSYIPGFSTIISAFRDSHQNMWVGSYMSGVFRFDGALHNYKKFTDADGLLYNGCWGLNEDQKGNIWIVSPRGLSIMDPLTNQVRNISAANGLPEEPVSSRLFKTTKGLFLSGSKNGFFSWNPGDFFAQSSLAPRMHIESVSFPASTRKKADSAIVTFDKYELRLRYDQNRITFSYVGLQYQSPGLTQYAYRLEEYDKEWRNGGTQRQVTYTNLSPGTYTFHVKAMNSDGIWSEKEAAITLTISPPWWKTWWAYCLYVLLAAAAILYYIRARSRVLRQENLLLEEKIAQRTRQLEQSLSDLQSAQAQIIQSEKMASLGELTAGIAHEIQNPLNFVNNFAEVSSELVDEMNLAMDKGDNSDAMAIAADLRQNLQKINHHGKRADAIVKNMLQHSKAGSGEKGLANINALTDEHLRLAYHGLRARDKLFNATLQTDFDEAVGDINVIPQDIGRVLLNIITNAFYAVDEKKKTAGENYQPLVSVQTKKRTNKVEIRITDNGNGIPEKITDKIFQPFFTTKPTGQGTGLGLSLAYDIVKAHGGSLKVETIQHEGSVFIIELPAL